MSPVDPTPPTMPRRRTGRALKAVGAATVFCAILGSSSIAFADTNATPKPSLLGSLTKSLSATTSGLTTTLNSLTAPLGINLNLDLGLEFGLLNTARPVSRTDVRTAINSAGATKSGLTGAGVDVALIDTGVAPVAGLNTADALANGPDLSLDQQAGMPASVDAFGHGTHLAGIIAGRDGGIAPGSRLINMKVGAADGAVDVSQVIAAIDWVVTHHDDPGFNIRVINLSYGTDSAQLYTSSPLTHAVESAWRNGIVVVVSAGNGGVNSSLLNPATDPFVLTVGAIDVNQPVLGTDDKLATYSSPGNATRGVDVVAPGTSIESIRVPGSTVDTQYPASRSTDGTKTRGSGTSQAAAVVSGAAAVLLQQRPELTPDQVKALLETTARPLPKVSAAAQGTGVIDVGRAVLSSTPKNSAQKFAPSTGTGSLEEARGTAHLSADDGTVLEGESDLQGAPWNAAAWAASASAGTAWTGGTWNGNEWAGPDWDPSKVVDGISWSSRSWRSSTWSSRSWRADLWASRSWRDAGWESRSWRGNSWR